MSLGLGHPAGRQDAQGLPPGPRHARRWPGAASSTPRSVYRIVTFPAVPVGSVLDLDYEVRERPYSPSGSWRLGSSEATEPCASLPRRRCPGEVTARGGGAGWRWRIDGARRAAGPGDAGRRDGHRPRASRALNPPERAPGIAAAGAVLRYAWGDLAGWEAVGRWYEGLLAQVTARRRAGAGQGAGADRRASPTAASAWRRWSTSPAGRCATWPCEVGIGGYRPHPPQQVMERRWGDCKDKALLLVDLLREAGIEAYPALALLDPEGAGGPRVPLLRPIQPPDRRRAGRGPRLWGRRPGLRRLSLPRRHPGDRRPRLAPAGGPGPGDPGGARRHGASWCGPPSSTVSRASGWRWTWTSRRVVRRPAPPGSISPASPGLRSSSLHKGGKPVEVDRAVRHVFNALLPAGAALDGIRWQSIEGGVPEVRLEAKVKVPSLGSPAEAGRLPHDPPPQPDRAAVRRAARRPDGARDRQPFSSRVTWKVSLPREACKAESPDVKAENAVGAFHQKVAVQGRSSSWSGRRSCASAGSIPPPSRPSRRSPRRVADEQAAAAGKLRAYGGGGVSSAAPIGWPSAGTTPVSGFMPAAPVAPASGAASAGGITPGGTGATGATGGGAGGRLRAGRIRIAAPLSLSSLASGPTFSPSGISTGRGGKVCAWPITIGLVPARIGDLQPVVGDRCSAAPPWSRGRRRLARRGIDRGWPRSRPRSTSPP